MRTTEPVGICRVAIGYADSLVEALLPNRETQCVAKQTVVGTVKHDSVAVRNTRRVPLGRKVGHHSVFVNVFF